MAQLFASLILTYALTKLIHQPDGKRMIPYIQKKRKHNKKTSNINLNNKCKSDQYNICKQQQPNKFVLRQKYSQLNDPRMSLFAILMDEIFDNEIGIEILLPTLDLYTVQLIFKYLDILCHPNPIPIVQFQPYYKDMQFQLKQWLNDLKIIIDNISNYYAKQEETCYNLSKKIMISNNSLNINTMLFNRASSNRTRLNKAAPSFFPTLTEKDEWQLHTRLTLEQLRQFSKKSVMYIAQDITFHAIKDIKEYFESPRALFQYLRFRLIKNVIDGTYNILSKSGGSNNQYSMIVLFDVDLHKKKNGEKLYVVGIDNDADKTKTEAEKWKMQGFMTKQDIISNYDIFSHLLPTEKVSLSLDFHNQLFANLRMRMDIWSKLTVVRSAKQKKAKSKQKIIKSAQEFHEIVLKAINKRNKFEKIIFIEPRCGTYKEELLLPIKLKDNNWIAITFDLNGNPHQICIDCYDIRQKMALYKAFKNTNQYQWLQNNMVNLEINNEMPLMLKYQSLEKQCKDLQIKNRNLEIKNKELKEQIKDLKQ